MEHKSKCNAWFNPGIEKKMHIKHYRNNWQNLSTDYGLDNNTASLSGFLILTTATFVRECPCSQETHTEIFREKDTVPTTYSHMVHIKQSQFIYMIKWDKM